MVEHKIPGNVKMDNKRGFEENDKFLAEITVTFVVICKHATVVLK